MGRRPEPRCPVRPGEFCTLCQMGVTGPADCGLVYLLRDDDDWTVDSSGSAENGADEAAAGPPEATD